MAVPAHDQRDWEFAKKFDLPMIQILEGGDIEKEAFTEDGIHINSEFLNGLDKPTAIEKIIEFLEKKGVGERTVNYKLRDWIFSRQRYWGEPIPLIHCPHCGTVAVPENQLPLRLPQVQRYEPTGTGESPLAAIDEWVNTVCPKCGSAAKRETNTMPQWAGSPKKKHTGCRLIFTSAELSTLYCTCFILDSGTKFFTTSVWSKIPNRLNV